MRHLIKRLFPDHTPVGSLIRRLAILLGLAHKLPFEDTFASYVRDTEPKLFLPVVDYLPSPLFSVVIPFFNTPDRYLHPLLESLKDQTFQSWELVMADASTDDVRSAAIRMSAEEDPRFRYVRLEKNAGISGNTNQALRHAKAPYLVFADHDDLLSPHALNEAAHVIVSDPGVDILYSDEDVVSEDGAHRKRPAFKPDWSPHTFLETNYTNHLSVMRRELVERVGALREECDGSQDYDLLLRIHALPQRISVAHIPKILYHWREAVGSTAFSLRAKPFAVDAGRRALSDHLKELGIPSEPVEAMPDKPGWFRVRPRWRATADVVVLLASLDEAKALVAALEERTKCTWATPNFFAVSTNDELSAHMHATSSEAVVVIREPFIPAGVDWLDDLVGVLSLPQTAEVSPLLVDDQGVVISAGLVENTNGAFDSLYQGWKTSEIGPEGHVDMVRDVVALHSAVIAYRTPESRHPPEKMASRAREEDGYRVVWAHQQFMKI